MNGKALIPLVAGLGIGGFALWMGVQTLRSVRGAQRPVEQTTVWAAKETIARGAEINEEMLVSIPFPKSLMPEGAITDKDKLLGRVPNIDAPAGLPILESMLLPPGMRAGLHVKPGFRAVAVKIDESSGVDYHIQPGSFVDVVGSFQVRRARGNETLARTIVENVEIAAVGPRISAVEGRDEGEKQSSRSVRAVTLFVRPEDVPKLLLAEQKGKIKLGLRSDATGADSDESSSTRMVSDAELTGEGKPGGEDAKEGPSAFIDQIKKLLSPQAPQPAPTAPAPPPVVIEVPQDTWEVVVVRGDDRKSIRFKNRGSREVVGSDEGAGGPSLFGNPPRKPAAEPPTDTPPADTPPADEQDSGPDQPPQEAQG